MYDDYCDTEVEVTLSVGDSIYDIYDNLEEVVEDCVTNHICLNLLSREISFALHILKAEEIHDKLEFHVDAYLDPSYVTWLGKRTDFTISDHATYNDVSSHVVI